MDNKVIKQIRSVDVRAACMVEKEIELINAGVGKQLCNYYYYIWNQESVDVIVVLRMMGTF